MGESVPLAVGGNRLQWCDLPDVVRETIERGVGGRVTHAESREGGFSPGLASILTLRGRGRVFVKAVGAKRNEFTLVAIRREAEVLAELPAIVPAPRLHWRFDGELDGDDWAIVIMDAVDGRTPAQPWRPDELSRFLRAASVLAESLEPRPPVPAAVFTEAYDFHRWSALAADPASAARLDPPIRGRLDDLARLDQGFDEAAAGGALLHGDLRADNVLLTASSVAIVDWPSIAIGARWLDLLFALPSVAMHGGGDPDELWRGHPLSMGVDDDAINSVVAGMAGFFIDRSLQPALPLLPTIRQFQRAQGLQALRWLAGRLDWPELRA
jgi:aminoglycoside phosphotransferase (APT) family kinase protein